MDSEDQSLDSIFGQQRAFSLDDPLVDPHVVAYLQGVRTQALRTSAISTHGRSASPKHSADLYDDEVPSKGIPESLSAIEDGMSPWVEWFNETRDIILEEGKSSHEYDDDSLELVLHHLKNYLQEQKGLKGISAHVLNILQDLGPMSKSNDGDDGDNDELEIDPEWAQSMLLNFKSQKIASLEDLKNCIKSKNQTPPRGFKEWYHFLQSHEPAHTYFTGKIINGETLWTLVQYMSHDWIKDIHKQKRFSRAQRFSAWLLYILFHIPTNVTAEYVSNIRELGKRCKKAILADAMVAESKRPVLLKDCQSSEMVELSTPSPPPELDILRLTLVVIAVVYRQRDLTNWQDQAL
ncbi:hypothetical protein ZYGR_0I06780 [Zygosaccharomyces rouxii]|uniref:ZYRO0C16060p n=2 Tax=Zygosaccharomyces rouxii TaxID=4956 RepID=C5DUE3_ZYGRC|nr:uncharacterized protein ZYRO0C16060g [Zygosaccharomyces rouxii]KAH9201424.1 hypothetical protein LQ764DRAFT_208186 [Zygosaccharomyces rouxii]GAV48381.1 hypothetical protein ZYGR_0I06780 [Zygosaccharomyces rouxii]CAR27404.1 ZYRO0C16060p [Zygosaccharomyces rouxii]